ncbi:hypothetical protein FOL47_009733 [Perkinsus chesapeaki]|uniref:Uncharacterized protein n=1 Tax=Perkinsus chesapeaki TaxID=330153 RepID=A0A7J6N1R2_PERCH|nr:hypothetical protein FOL47_009733 [Perkinsus chesapeaki]
MLETQTGIQGPPRPVVSGYNLDQEQDDQSTMLEAVAASVVARRNAVRRRSLPREGCLLEEPPRPFTRTAYRPNAFDLMYGDYDMLPPSEDRTMYKLYPLLEGMIRDNDQDLLAMVLQYNKEKAEEEKAIAEALRKQTARSRQPILKRFGSSLLALVRCRSSSPKPVVAPVVPEPTPDKLGKLPTSTLPVQRRQPGSAPSTAPTSRRASSKSFQ